ncbi:MAG: sigma 54-interacting transcriptional regulator [Gemmatimonadetes bacterium]|nr:sigma 54-interacting transcriptional regulator [Gemmatimonadota bacterium]
MDCTDLYDTAPWKAQKSAALAAAATPWPILLTGPRGSGKSLLARFIHRHSSRAAGEFVEAPAPTLSEGLLQGELRGHVRGAFTDARVDHKGLLERANGGTLFFDEIEAASPALQALLVSLVESSPRSPGWGGTVAPRERPVHLRQQREPPRARRGRKAARRPARPDPVPRDPAPGAPSVWRGAPAAHGAFPP